MRILFLNPVATIGGAEQVLLQIFSSLREVAPQLKLSLITLDDGPLLAEAALRGVEARSVPLPPGLASWGDSRLQGRGRFRKLWSLARDAVSSIPSLWKHLEQLRRTIRSIKPDLIHSNGIKTHLLVGLAGSVGAPIVWHIHDFYSSRPAAAKLLQLARRRVRAGIAISRAAARDVRRLSPNLPIAIIHNTVDAQRFSPAPADGEDLDRLASLPSVPEKLLRIGLVATYARWKGHEVFLRAAAEVIRTAPSIDARFYVVGGPIYRTAAQYTLAELQDRVRELGLGDRVGFIPFQKDPSAIYRSLDVTVHASTQPEPFGLTIIEAMACGSAVIVSRAGGAVELFEPEVEALAVPPGDVLALAQAIHRLLLDRGLRERLGCAARRRIERDFNSERLGKELLAFYRRFLPTLNP